MNILLLGGGGRENALAWKMIQSPKLTNLYIAPGNAGTASIAHNIDVSATDFEGIKELAIDKDINMLVVGPEAPLVKGIYDFFKNDKQLKHITVIAPSKEGAQLEGSKDFAKQFMQRHNIPTARFKSFSLKTLVEGYTFLEELNAPYVLKADGLAAGKGVLILDELEEAKKELELMIKGSFGEASATVVIEEFLSGIECSVFVITDGKDYKILPEAKDYKRIGEGDTGLNTGGMGAISPVSFADNFFMEKLEQKIIIPTIKGIQKEGIDYQGFIFFGIISVEGEPMVIEYNARLGDPETEAIIPRIKSDIIDLFEGVRDNNLNSKKIEIDKSYCTTIMLVSGGYPEEFENNKQIKNLDKTNCMVFHAATKLSGDKVLTNGGRVIAVSALGKTKDEALATAFENAETIDFQGKYYRKDIGFDVL